MPDRWNPLRELHRRLVVDRRIRVLAGHMSDLLPRGAKVLDVGCGDGKISRAIADARPDIEVRGIEVFLRGDSLIPIEPYDGEKIPFADDSFDAVMMVDVLHHTHDPSILLREAGRVASHAVVLKDHTRDGWLAEATLRFMDRTGNPPEGVDFPYNYWPEARWLETFAELGLDIEEWRGRPGLFAPPADWIFGRSLHFVARLSAPGT